MIQYVLRRLLAMIPTLLGITFITFLMISLAPGDPVATSLGVAGGAAEGGGGGPKSAATQAIAAKKKLLGILEKDRHLRLWRVPDGAEAAGSEGAAHPAVLELASRSATFEGWPRAISPAPGGALLVGTDAGEVVLVDAATGEHQRSFPPHPNAVWAVAIDTAGTLVASGDSDGGLHLMHTTNGRQVAVEPLGKTIRALAFVDGGRTLVAATSDGVLRAYDAADGKLLHQRRDHTGFVADLAVSADGTRLWSAGFDRKLREWDAPKLELRRVLGTHGQAVNAVALAADGSRLATACDDRVVRVFDLRTDGAPVAELRGHVKEVTAVALSADGARAYSGSKDESVRAWDVATQTCTSVSADATGEVHGLAAGTDGAGFWSSSESWVKAPVWKRYVKWLGKIVTFDFDRSLTDERKVSEKILKALPITVGINVLAILIIYVVSIPLGVAAAVKRGSKFDSASSVVLFLLYSIPSFWAATLLITNFSSERAFNWFPCVGLHAPDHERLAYLPWLKDHAAHLVLPMVVICYGGFSGLSRFVRTSMLETISQDYVRTARAKGLSERVVIFKHAFRNSLVTIVTLLATLLPGMIGGSVIIEQIFGIPGMGWLGFEAISERDYPVIMAVTTMSAVLTLVGVLVSDLLYSVVDPRVPSRVSDAVQTSERAALEKAQIARGEGYWALVWSQFRKNGPGMTGLWIIAVIVLTALLAPLLANDRPIACSYKGNLSFPAFATYVDDWVPWPSVRSSMKSWQPIDGVLPFSENYPELAGRSWKQARIDDADGFAWSLWPPVAWNPTQIEPDKLKKPPSQTPDHVLGTDNQGRDVLSRILHGTVIACLVGIVAMGIATTIGLALGVTAGFFGGWTDLALSRFTEIVMCFPTFFLIIAAISFLERSIINIMIVIGFVGWTGIYRLIRGEVLKVKMLDYVVAAHALGVPRRRIMFRHILPNSVAPVFVSVAFGIAGAVLTEASLSFLGFGDPSVPSWGEIVNQGRLYVVEGLTHLTYWSGFAIFTTLTAFNLFGQGLRDAMDPRLRR